MFTALGVLPAYQMPLVVLAKAPSACLELVRSPKSAALPLVANSTYDMVFVTDSPPPPIPLVKPPQAPMFP